MDALAGLLDGPRARQAFLLRLVMAPPWSIWVDDHAALTLVAVLRGQAWITPPTEAPTRVGAGEVAVVRGPDAYAFADPAGTPPQVVALPEGRCSSTAGVDLGDSLRHGVRTWGTDPGRGPGGAEVLIGAYEGISELGRRLLDALPPVLVVPAADLQTPLVDVLAAEIDRDAPGQQVVLDRLLDLLLVAVLRTWFARPDAGAPGWFRASADPVVGPALRL
ncbi:MAG: cupin domain-containing protein, partial [Acidimicrobiia bacterium]|nr:cupin domain-containing protein [Acidimicrobiia bacterium]